MMPVLHSINLSYAQEFILDCNTVRRIEVRFRRMKPLKKGWRGGAAESDLDPENGTDYLGYVTCDTSNLATTQGHQFTYH